MEYVAGLVYGNGSFTQGHVGYDAGVIREVGDGAPPETPAAEGVIVPSPVNAHTHVGDAVARGHDIPTDLEAAVAPPNGLKHQILRKSTRKDLVAGINEVAREMLVAGSRRFLDFRESGLDGVDLLEEAVEGTGVAPTLLARPQGMGYDEAEVAALLERAHGIGLSGINDVEPAVADALADHAHRAGKLFALHASEGVREDVDRVLALEPHLIVHMVCASEDDLALVADAGVPICVCPRSNAHFGALPDVAGMVDAGVTVTLGTDNAMLNSADMFREMAFLRTALPDLAPATILEMATTNGLRVLGEAHAADPLRPGAPADFVVLEPRGANPFLAAMAEPRVVHTPLAPRSP